MSSPARRIAAASPMAVAVAIPLSVLAIFFLLPVGGMLHRGLWTSGRFAPSAAIDVLTSPRTRQVVWFTAWSAGAATLVAILGGLPLAHCLYRLRFPGRSLLRAVTLVPFVLPAIVVGVAFTQVLGPGGPLARLNLAGTGTAIVAALAYFNIGLVARVVGSYWSSLDVRREQAAAALGANPLQVFVTVTLPALAPSVIAAASVVFLFCATSFGVVLTMGGFRYANVETEIYLLTTQELDLRSAAALSLVQVLIIIALLAFVGRVRSRQAASDRVPEPPRRPRRGDLVPAVPAVLALAFLAVPMVSLTIASLRQQGSWTLANYRALATTGDQALLVPATSALSNSLQIAVQAAVLAVVLGVLVSWVASRRPRSRTGKAMVAGFDGAFMLPLGVSAVTLGFGFLITLNRPPLDLRTSEVLIPIAQGLVALPLVVRTVAPAWRGVDDRLRQATSSMGAGPARVFASVDLVAGWRPLLASTGFAFAVSLGEFGATSFLARDSNPTLPVVIYRLLGTPGLDHFGMAMAGCVVLSGATAVVMLIVERVRVGTLGAL